MEHLRLELSAIKLSLTSKDKFSMLSPDIFIAPQVKDLYNIIFKIYQEDKELPSLVRLELKIKEYGEILKFQEILDALNNLDVKDDDFNLVLKHLKENKLSFIIKNRLNDAGQKLTSKDISGTINILKNCVEEVNQDLSLSDNTFFTIGDNTNSAATEDDIFKEDYFVPTGFEELDKKITGFGKNELIILAAPKGSSKSALSLVMGVNAYRLNKNVVYCNFEMSYRDWLHRYLTAISGISNDKIRSNNLTIEEKFQLKKSFILEHYIPEVHPVIEQICNKNKEKILKTDMFVVTKAFTKKVMTEKRRRNHYSTIENFRPSIIDLSLSLEKIRSLKGLDMVIIDYINFLKHPNEKLPGWEKLRDISVHLKSLAKNLDCTLVVLAQLEPKEQDTKYSRGITESADLALGWEFKEQISEEISVYELYTIKGRFTGRIKRMELVSNVNKMEFQIRQALE